MSASYVVPGELEGKLIAIPETRENEAFAELLKARGAAIFSCPLMGVVDAPDNAAVMTWLDELAQGGFHDVLFMTGEGVKRLMLAAEKAGRRAVVIQALRSARKITRGPKPARELTALGLKADLAAETATTDGLISTLDREAIAGHRIGVQLFGDDPNGKLIGYLESRQARPAAVVAYVYAPKAEDSRCVELITKMAEGRIDLVAFTSALQVRRLREIAKERQLEVLLSAGLKRARLAAIGPVVARELALCGAPVQTDGAPMVLKQFVKSICARFA
jgi:uroporphyrinogen-III synthase